jgi:enediyne biosynthesis protein E4
MNNLFLSILIFCLTFLLSSNNGNAQFVLSDQQLGQYVSLGIACGDYDNDGDDDIYFANGDAQGNAWEGLLFKNDGNGIFSPVNDAGPLISEIYTSAGCSWGDYNNDGFLDLIVTNPVSSPNRSKISLYSNNGDGTFSNLDADLLTLEEAYAKFDPSWADYNNDGWLDVLISNARFEGTGENSSLYSNNHDSTFSVRINNLTRGITARGSVCWVDADNDGNMDALTTGGSIDYNTTLWINTGSEFTENILITGGSATGRDTDGASWGDYDNDGDMDLYLINHGQTGDSNLLFRNDSLDESGNVILTSLDSSSGIGDLVSDIDLSVVSAWGDVDNDGDLDLFVGNDGSTDLGHHSQLYINNNFIFSKSISDDIYPNADSIRSAAFSDVDNDGDLDLITGRAGKNYLFINTLDKGNNWLKIKLTGSQANKSALGARVKIKATIHGDTVKQIREVQSHTGARSQNSLVVHFGLGDAAVVDELTVEWPGNGNKDILTNIPANQYIEITETYMSSIEKRNPFSPVKIYLLQNYPNPFNPITTIKFNMPAAGNVSLKIYNTLGQRIITLIDGFKNAGEYNIKFNASNLHSGIYFYTLQTRNSEITKKMVLLQ